MPSSPKTQHDHSVKKPMTLADLKKGQTGTILRITRGTDGANLAALGVVKGVAVSLDQKAPFGDPRVFSLMGYRLTLREEDARHVEITVN